MVPYPPVTYVGRSGSAGQAGPSPLGTFPPRPAAANRHQQPLGAVIADQRLGLLGVPREPPPNRLRVVVGTTLLLRPGGQPLDELLVRHLQQDDRLERS